jgi:hypothetical protein
MQMHARPAKPHGNSCVDFSSEILFDEDIYDLRRNVFIEVIEFHLSSPGQIDRDETITDIQVGPFIVRYYYFLPSHVLAVIWLSPCVASFRLVLRFPNRFRFRLGTPKPRKPPHPYAFTQSPCLLLLLLLPRSIPNGQSSPCEAP